MTSSRRLLIRLQAWTRSSLGKLVNTSLMDLMRESLVLWGDLLVSLSATPHTKKSKGLRSGLLGGHTSFSQKWGKLALGGLVHELALAESVALVAQVLLHNGPHQPVRAAYLPCHCPHGHPMVDIHHVLDELNHVVPLGVTAATVGLPFDVKVLILLSTGQKVIVQLWDLLNSWDWNVVEISYLWPARIPDTTSPLWANATIPFILRQLPHIFF
mgnify:CR=1 FL=1